MDDPSVQPQNVNFELSTDRYLTGPRLWFAGFGSVLAVPWVFRADRINSLALSVFLPALEVSIISTSLISISDALNGYDQISWIVTAYLVTYTGLEPITKPRFTLTYSFCVGFLVPWSKLCDTAGLRPTLFVSMVLFIGFSAGCGASKSITQL